MDSQQQKHNDILNSENAVEYENQDTNTVTDTKECAGEFNVSEDGSKQAQSNLKGMEAALKSELRSIHTLVGRKLDIQNSKPLRTHELHEQVIVTVIATLKI